MTDESPLPSSSTDTTSPPLNISKTPTLSLSLPCSSEVGPSILEVGVTDEIQSTQSPKKPKFDSLNPSLAYESGMIDRFLQASEKLSEIEELDENSKEMSGLDGNYGLSQSALENDDVGFELKDEFLQVSSKISVIDGKCELRDSGNLSEVEHVGVNWNEVFQSESDKKNEGFEAKDEFLQVSTKFSVFDAISEVQGSVKFSEIEQVGVNLNEVSQSELEKKNEGFEVKEGYHQVPTKFLVFDGSGECQDSENYSEIEQVGVNLDEVSQSELEKKNEGFVPNVEFLGINDEKSLESGVSETVQLGCEKRLENCNGFLQKLVKGEELASSLKIDMIDGTLLLDVEGTDVVDDVSMAGDSRMEGKQSRRRGKKGNSSRNTIGCVAGDSNGGGRKKYVYSRKDMEGMRHVNFKGQRKYWNEIYSGFSDIVKKEYDELGSFKHQQTGGGKKNCNNGGFVGSCSTVPNFNNRGIMGDACSGNVSCDAEIISSSNFTYEGDKSGKDGDDLVGDWTEDEESDDEYESIHRPAFKVEGEPDFESGPPEDGLEYLRRVRWEAKNIPKVKVAKLNNIKVKDQSVYMLEIPDIEECPPHLVPLMSWEDEFIADFSELRLALSRLEDSSDAVSVDSESVIFSGRDRKSHPSQNFASLQLASGAPTLASVLATDHVTRVTMLRRRISLFESANDLSKDNCAWLFALCAVVETPLDADTCASLRCLLRSCAKLRAGKAEVDDEVIMLTILATISGRLFGQSGK